MKAKNKNQCGDLRLRLLRAASEIISNEGLKKLTMRALSNQVGVSRTAPYRHFKNKDALLLSIAEEGFNEFLQLYVYLKTLETLAENENVNFIVGVEGENLLIQPTTP